LADVYDRWISHFTVSPKVLHNSSLNEAPQRNAKYAHGREQFQLHAPVCLIINVGKLDGKKTFNGISSVRVNI
jgi:hypothetical protein